MFEIFTYPIHTEKRTDLRKKHGPNREFMHVVLFVLCLTGCLLVCVCVFFKMLFSFFPATPGPRGKWVQASSAIGFGWTTATWPRGRGLVLFGIQKIGALLTSSVVKRSF